jgi:hypothetical protein
VYTVSELLSERQSISLLLTFVTVAVILMGDPRCVGLAGGATLIEKTGAEEASPDAPGETCAMQEDASARIAAVNTFV